MVGERRNEDGGDGDTQVRIGMPFQLKFLTFEFWLKIALFAGPPAVLTTSVAIGDSQLMTKFLPI